MLSMPALKTLGNTWNDGYLLNKLGADAQIVVWRACDMIRQTLGEFLRGDTQDYLITLRST
jgi:hypothetical protein